MDNVSQVIEKLSPQSLRELVGYIVSDIRAAADDPNDIISSINGGDLTQYILETLSQFNIHPLGWQ